MADFEGLPPGALIADFSSAQDPENVDYDALADLVDGVMIRASQGVVDSVPVGVDTAFVAHLTRCLGVGLPVGVYHAVVPYRDAIEQADFFLHTTAPYRKDITLGYALDAELDYDLEDAVITECLYRLAKEVDEALGIKPDMYTRKNFWEQHTLPTYDAYFGQCRLWLAAHGATNPLVPRGWSNIWLHQFTNAYELTGKDGKLLRVDMNKVMGVSPAAKFTLLHPVQASVGCQIVVTSKFGVPRDYDGDGIKDDQHEGTDFAPVGNVCLPNIVACADGVVESISTVGAYGNRIKIRHTWGAETYVTWYCHLSVIEVKKGAVVKRGQVIGVMGSTGNSTGTHLHLNLVHVGHGLTGFVVDDVVDPETYLK